MPNLDIHIPGYVEGFKETSENKFAKAWAANHWQPIDVE